MRPWREPLGPIVLICLAVFSGSVPVSGEQPTREGRRFTVGFATWFSRGNTEFAHDSSAGDPLLGNPTSRLDYSGVDGTVFELDASVRLFSRMSLSGRGGFGSISGGTLLDDDFLSAQGAQFYMTSIMGAHRYSRTRSDVDGDDLDYFEIELSRHLLSEKKPRRGHLKVFGSVRSWREHQLATGLEQLECTAPNVLCLPTGPPVPALVGEPVIRESSEWLVGLVGVEGEWRSKGRLEVSGRVGYGLSDVESDDVHLLRSDLAQDPSFRWTGDGPAFDLELAGHYRVSPRFRVGLGYRLWNATADDGVLTQFSSDGSIAQAPLLRYEARRDGVFLYLEHRSAN